MVDLTKERQSGMYANILNGDGHTINALNELADAGLDGIITFVPEAAKAAMDRGLHVLWRRPDDSIAGAPDAHDAASRAHGLVLINEPKGKKPDEVQRESDLEALACSSFQALYPSLQIGACSRPTGNPGGATPEEEEQAVLAMANAHKNATWTMEHGYQPTENWPVLFPDDPFVFPHHLGRIIRYVDICRKHNIYRPPYLGGEWGMDVPWWGNTNRDRFHRAMTNVVEWIMRNPWAKGMGFFNLGNDGRESFKYQDLLEYNDTFRHFKYLCTLRYDPLVIPASEVIVVVPPEEDGMIDPLTEALEKIKQVQVEFDQTKTKLNELQLELDHVSQKLGETRQELDDVFVKAGEAHNYVRDNLVPKAPASLRDTD